MKTFRDKMLAEGGNMCWCYPVSLLDGRIVVAVNEGEIVSMQIDGVDADLTQENLARAAKLLEPEYEREDSHPAEAALYDKIFVAPELECRDCPWFKICDAVGEEDESGKWILLSAIHSWKDANYPAHTKLQVQNSFYDDDKAAWTAIVEDEGCRYILIQDEDGYIQFDPIEAN